VCERCPDHDECLSLFGRKLAKPYTYKMRDEKMESFGFKPLDGLIDELKAKYCMKDDDVQRLIEAIQKYLAYVEEAWEQAEIGEI